MEINRLCELIIDKKLREIENELHKCNRNDSKIPILRGKYDILVSVRDELPEKEDVEKTYTSIWSPQSQYDPSIFVDN